MPVLPEHPHLSDATEVYAGERVRLVEVGWPLRSGGTRARAVAHTRDAVVVLPLLADGSVVMIQNHRHALGQTLLELPAGTIEPGEDPAEGARRELREEAGYDAGALKPLTAFYPCPGFATEFMHGFVATDLIEMGQSLDDVEQIEVKVMPWSEALAAVRSGAVRDAKTIAAVLFYEAFGASPMETT